MGLARRNPRNEAEFDHQCALFKWARMPSMQKQYPGLDLLCASLNGIHMTPSQAWKASQSGMLSGEHDVCLRVARGGYHGLSIELKAGKNKATARQLWYGDRLTEEGWLVGYCWHWTAAADLIMAYLSGRMTRI